MTTSHSGTSRPFTVYLCTICTAKPKLAVLEELRATIRRCAHGMLVTTACMRGPLACAARPHGPIVILQPCGGARSHRFGPLDWADQRQRRHTCPAGAGLNKASGTTGPCRIGYARSCAGPTALVETDNKQRTGGQLAITLRFLLARESSEAQRGGWSPRRGWPAISPRRARRRGLAGREALTRTTGRLRRPRHRRPRLERLRRLPGHRQARSMRARVWRRSLVPRRR